MSWLQWIVAAGGGVVVGAMLMALLTVSREPHVPHHPVFRDATLPRWYYTLRGSLMGLPEGWLLHVECWHCDDGLQWTAQTASWRHIGAHEGAGQQVAGQHVAMPVLRARQPYQADH